MPKCHSLPFWLECISGSRFLSLFFVELGAAIKVASTAVPALSSKPWAASRSLTVAENLLGQLPVDRGVKEGRFYRQI